MPRRHAGWLLALVSLGCGQVQGEDGSLAASGGATAAGGGAGATTTGGAGGTTVQSAGGVTAMGAAGGEVGGGAGLATGGAGGAGDAIDAGTAPNGGAGGSEVNPPGADAAANPGDGSPPRPAACGRCDPEESSCTVTGGQADCACPDGYRDVLGNGEVCEGIDECLTGEAQCADNATCVNTPSGYLCTCNDGFHGDGFTSCQVNPNCSVSGGDPCGDHSHCLDIGAPNEVCACGWDHEWTGTQCVEIDQCARGLDDCHGLAQCTDESTRSTDWFECTCPDGYLGDGHGDSGCFLPSSRLTEPRIPPIGPDPCPAFETGTSTHPDLLGAMFWVGSKSAAPDAPLLFYWHGTGSVAGEVESRLPAAMRQEILAAGGIIASFDTSTGTGGNCSGTGVFAKDDFKVADHIAACAVRDHNIDPKRIYVTGCSSGGLQAGCMAVVRSGYVAAVTTNFGGLMLHETMQAAHAPATFNMYAPPFGPILVDFGQTSELLDREVEAFGGTVVDCNHGLSHCGPPEELYLEAWEFMKAHPFGTEDTGYDPQNRPTLQTYCSQF